MIITWRDQSAKRVRPEFTVLHGFVGILVTLLTLIVVPEGSYAADMSEATEKVAKRIVDYLKARDQESIAISPFFAPSQLVASSGPGIVQTFTNHFERAGIAVRAGASITLQGRFHLDKAEHQLGKVVITIRGSLVDRYGEVLTDFVFASDPGDLPNNSLSGDQKKSASPPGTSLTAPKASTSVAPSASGKPVGDGEFDVQVDQENDVVKTLGLSTQLHPEDTSKDRQKDLFKALEQPSTRLSEDSLQVISGSFGLQVLVQGQPRPISLRGGRPFVALKRGETYALRIENNASHETAVEVTIDGINTFAFANQAIDTSSDHPPDLPPGPASASSGSATKFRHYLLPASRRTTVNGWHLSLSEISLFQITPFEKSAAGRLGHDGDAIGTITVMYSAAWPKNGEPPRDEKLVGRSARDATGFGATVGQVARPVEREIGRLRASISIRYEL